MDVDGDGCGKRSVYITHQPRTRYFAGLCCIQRLQLNSAGTGRLCILRTRNSEVAPCILYWQYCSDKSKLLAHAGADLSRCWLQQYFGYLFVLAATPFCSGRPQ